MAATRKNWTSRGARRRWLVERRKEAVSVEDGLLAELRDAKRQGRRPLLPGDFVIESDTGNNQQRKRLRRHAAPNNRDE